MAKKRALIVDDSKTARVVMGKRLESQQLEVDSVENAGAALDYLTLRRPDVVFMDVQMPGMDGFQALRAIKSNPVTAGIPVLMYTAQDSGLDTERAREMGAAGVLPKQVHEKELHDILDSLHLLPGQIAPPSDESTDDGQPATLKREAPPIARPQAQLRSIARQTSQSVDLRTGQGTAVLKNLLTQQLRQTKQEIESSHSRLSSELQKELSGLRQSIDKLAPPEPPRKRKWLMPALLGAACAALFLTYLELRQTQTERQALSRQLASQGTAASAVPTPLPAAPVAPQPKAVSPAWAERQTVHYPFEETAFGETRIAWVNKLVTELSRMGFEGTLRLRSHVGKFCLSEAADGTLQLAAKDAPSSQCRFSEQSDLEAIKAGTYQSIEFSNFLSSLPPSSKGRIQIDITSAGYNRPVREYPEPTADTSAEEWNRLADENQRIEVSLIPRKP